MMLTGPPEQQIRGLFPEEWHVMNAKLGKQEIWDMGETLSKTEVYKNNVI